MKLIETMVSITMFTPLLILYIAKTSEITSKILKSCKEALKIKEVKVVMNLLLDDIRMAGLGVETSVVVDVEKITIRGVGLRFAKKSGSWGYAITNSLGFAKVEGLDAKKGDSVTLMRDGNVLGTLEVAGAWGDQTKILNFLEDVSVKAGDILLWGKIDTVRWCRDDKKLIREVNGSKMVVYEGIDYLGFRQVEKAVEVRMKLGDSEVLGYARPRN